MLFLSVAVFGAGNIGRVVSLYLIESDLIDSVTVFDISRERLDNLAKEAYSDKLSTVRSDVLRDPKVTKMIRNFDAVSSLLPGNIGDIAYGMSIGCKTNLVDTSYTSTDPFKFDKRAKESNVVIVPDAGVAPGLSNLLVGHAVSEFDTVDKVAIYVGGLPQKPKPPVYHGVNWSVSDLLEEYSREARIVRGGKIETVEPLSGREDFFFKGFGLLEAFYTDGLRTLLKTIKANEMYEKTLRYSGHLDFIAPMYKMGFFSKTAVSVDNCNVKPIDFSSKIFQRSIFNPNMIDILLMEIIVRGKKNGKDIEINFHVIDYYDKENKVSAMARTTGYTNAATVELILTGKLESGIQPLENIGMNKKNFEFIIKRLERNGIKIERNVETV